MGLRPAVIYIILLLLLGGRSTAAQPTLRLGVDSVDAHSGDTITVAVRVSGFQQMLTAQGTLVFDSTIVEAIEAVPGALAGMSAASFGQSARRYLTFAWFDPAVSGQSLPDSAALFQVRFRVVGANGRRSALSFLDQPTVVEFTRVGFQPVTPVRVPGVIRVIGTTGLADATPPPGFHFFPNPATTNIAIVGAKAVWLTESLTGRRELLNITPSGQLDLRSRPPGHYLLAPVQARPTRAQALVLER